MSRQAAAALRCLSSWKDVTKDPLQSQQSVIFQVSLISHFVVCRKRPPPLHTATRLYVICSMLALPSSPLSSFHGSLAPNWIMLTDSDLVPYSSRHILPVLIFGGKLIEFSKFSYLSFCKGKLCFNNLKMVDTYVFLEKIICAACRIKICQNIPRSFCLNWYPS